jgi:ssDNA-binding Zn-finger/Zn-ribbon topoisomerase 1
VLYRRLREIIRKMSIPRRRTTLRKAEKILPQKARRRHIEKKPRFFCDNCGVEVDMGAKACPHCGRFFAAVRCPSCGFTGDDSTFKGGCPSCGYSAPSSNKGTSVNITPVPKKKIPTGSLPLWVYILSIGAFIFAVIILLLKLAK